MTPAVLVVLLSAAATDRPAELVARLNDPDYEVREAATRRLEGHGAAAVDALRAGCRSDDPETVRRAADVLRRVERRLANERALAPTLVDLDAKDRTLDSVLADLSKQAGFEVVLGGASPGESAARKVNVSTGGKVPFWEAVLRVCDAGELQVAGAGGFLAPGAVPYTNRVGRGVRVAADARRAVVLEGRGDAKPRPAAVYGAVLVEAVPFPAPTGPGDRAGALLQAWPEPRLTWEFVTGLKVVRAAGPGGNRLAAVDGPPGDEVVGTRNSVYVIQRTPPQYAPGVFLFTPNARQAVVRLAPAGKDAAGPREAKELAVTVFATARAGVEPLCRVIGLEADKEGSAAGPSGAEVSVRYTVDRKKLVATVGLAYDPRAVHPAGVGDDLPGVRGGGAGFGNHTVHGVRVTDADGKPYVLGLTSGANQFDPTGRRVVMTLTLELHPGRDDIGPPAAVTFWGTAAKPVEVPVVLRDVPLTGGVALPPGPQPRTGFSTSKPSP